MNKYFLLAIILIAFLVRVPLLDQYPNGFTPDEASFGYDAYSIVQTGRDQWGRFLPLVLESFGDFKAPLYTYLLIPFVAIFGLEVWVVRLPSAVFGVLAVIATYYLVRYLRLNQLKNYKFSKFNIEILCAFLLAISPWHVQLSRGAFEANLTAFLMPLGILFFLKGISKKKYLSLSALVFGLNLFSYHAARFVTPLIVGLLVIFFIRELKKLRFKYLLKPIVIFAIFFLIAVITLFQGGTKRAQDVSIFRGALQAQADARLAAIQSGVPLVIARITNNKYLIIIDRFKDNYFKYFSREYLVSNGPAEATYGMVPGIPVIYLVEVIGFIIFVIFSIINKNKVLIFILLSLMISVVPASLTMGVGYAGNRAATMLPFINIASSIGIIILFYFVQQKITYKYLSKIAVFVFIVFIFYQFCSFTNKYLDKQTNLVAKSMLYGRIELVENINSNFPNGKIVVTRRLSEPHIYFAFVNKTNPRIYQQNTKDWVRYSEEGLTFLDQMYKYSLGRYTFKAIEKADFDNIEGESVVVVLPDELPTEISSYETIFYPSGEPAMYIIKI